MRQVFITIKQVTKYNAKLLKFLYKTAKGQTSQMDVEIIFDEVLNDFKLDFKVIEDIYFVVKNSSGEEIKITQKDLIEFIRVLMDGDKETEFKELLMSLGELDTYFYLGVVLRRSEDVCKDYNNDVELLNHQYNNQLDFNLNH